MLFQPVLEVALELVVDGFFFSAMGDSAARLEHQVATARMPLFFVVDKHIVIAP